MSPHACAVMPWGGTSLAWVGATMMPLQNHQKTLFLCLEKSPPDGYPSHPPPHRVENLRSLQVERTQFQDADTESGRGIGMRRKGEGGK